MAEKINLVDRELENMSHRSDWTVMHNNDITVHFFNVRDFMEKHYGFTNIRLVLQRVYNLFMTANDKNGHRLFIKSCRHPGLCENEYKMGLELYNIDPVHFLQPLYFHDDEQMRFFANEFIKGKSLTAMHINGEITPKIRQKMLQDIYEIFVAMKKSTVVHRDIRPDNLVWVGGHLKLIDFQTAVHKGDAYVELPMMVAKPTRLRGLGDTYRYKAWTWDDAYSLIRCLKYIGFDASCRKEYRKIYHEIKSYIGTDTIHSSVRETTFARILRHAKKLLKNK